MFYSWQGINREQVAALLNDEQNLEECDATGFNSSSEAGNIKKFIHFYPLCSIKKSINIPMQQEPATLKVFLFSNGWLSHRQYTSHLCPHHGSLTMKRHRENAIQENTNPVHHLPHHGFVWVDRPGIQVYLSRQNVDNSRCTK